MKIYKIITSIFYIAIVIFIAVIYFLNREKTHDDKAELLTDNLYFEQIVKDIYDAKKEIICSISTFKIDYRYQRQPDDPVMMLVNSFIKSTDNGVNVKLLIETSQDGKYIQENNIKAAKLFDGSKVEIFYDESKERLNSKLCVIDDYITYLGSHNFTHSAMRKNKEASAKIISNEFNEQSKKYLQEIIAKINLLENEKKEFLEELANDKNEKTDDDDE